MANWKMLAGILGGSVTGSLLGYFVARIQYKRKLVKEVNEYRISIVQAAHRLEAKKQEIQEANDILEKSEEESVPVAKPETVPEKKEFEQKSIDDYIDYTGPYDGGTPKTISESVKSKDQANPISGPYSIDPDEYGTLMDYDQVHLTYYSDGVLVDDNDNIIEGYKLDDTVGRDFKTHFGEYSEDGIWFRNDDTQCEYEVERCEEPFYGS